MEFIYKLFKIYCCGNDSGGQRSFVPVLHEGFHEELHRETQRLVFKDERECSLEFKEKLKEYLNVQQSPRMSLMGNLRIYLSKSSNLS